MEDKEYTRYEGCASAVAVIIALVVLALVLCSCRTKYITETEYKEVPVVMHDTVQSEAFVRNRIHQKEICGQGHEARPEPARYEYRHFPPVLGRHAIRSRRQT